MYVTKNFLGQRDQRKKLTTPSLHQEFIKGTSTQGTLGLQGDTMGAFHEVWQGLNGYTEQIDLET